MISMSHPFAMPATDDKSAESLAEAIAVTQAESFWLKEAKAALKSRDPVDAAHDVEALARWADLRCGDILQTATAAMRGTQNG